MRSLLLTIVFSVLAVGPAGAVSTHDNSARFLAQRTYSSHLKANLSEISEMPQGIKSLAKFKRKSSTARPLLGQKLSTSRPQQEASIPQRKNAILPKQKALIPEQKASIPEQKASIPQQKSSIPQQKDAIFPGRKDRVPYLPRSQGSSPKHSRFFPGRG